MTDDFIAMLTDLTGVSNHLACALVEANIDEVRQQAIALRADRDDLREHVDFGIRMAQKREAPYVEQWRRETGKPDTLPDYGDLLHWVIARREALLAAARRYAIVLRTWDAETNRLPLPPACAAGTCGFPLGSDGAPCGTAAHPGNEWDHAEAHFLAAVDAADSNGSR